MALAWGAHSPAGAQVSGEATISLGAESGVSTQDDAGQSGLASSRRPKVRPDAVSAPAPDAPPSEDAVDPEALSEPSPEQLTPQPAAKTPRDPTKGAVTSLPIPRFVSLKGNEGNARRGPSLSHRIDWVFTTSGMPLRVTAEHENWRRVEDAEGMGGWVHYALLSGVRSALVISDLAEFRAKPDAAAAVVFQAERGVIGRLSECQPDWCRMNVAGEKGWIQKSALWGVDPGEVLE